MSPRFPQCGGPGRIALLNLRAAGWGPGSSVYNTSTASCPSFRPRRSQVPIRIGVRSHICTGAVAAARDRRVAMSPPVRHLVALALATSIACAGSVVCLPNAIPEVQRINVTTNVPFGFFLQERDSSMLVTEVAKVLISEVLGYNVAFSGTVANDGNSVVAVSGCKQRGEALDCGIGPLPDDHPHHAVF